VEDSPAVALERLAGAEVVVRDGDGLRWCAARTASIDGARPRCGVEAQAARKIKSSDNGTRFIAVIIIRAL
jgi:hypothetical protein